MRITLNGSARDVAEPMTLSILLKDLGINPGRVAVEVNLQIIDRTEFDRTILKAGDKVEIIGFVGGGTKSNHGYE